MLKIGVLVSGGGTNLQAILDAIDAGEITNAKVDIVISNNASAYALERARKHDIEAVCIAPKDYPDREAFHKALLAKLQEKEVDLIVLAGYLVAIPPMMVEAYPNKIINIHPSLIPSFCGKGFYGLKVHDAVLARGVKVTGATVHFVDAGTDTGPICQDLAEAEAGVKEIMEDKKFGNAGNTMVIEEFMTGREVSVLSFVDGKTIRTMTSAQDHKRAKDGDQGLNTGGMGTFSPSPFYTPEVDEFCKKYVYQKTVDAMAAEGRPFKGIIFFGLMLTADGPKVLEYNARFGDPEAQVVLPRMENDIIEVMEACVDGKLDQIDLKFEDNAAVCVVLASDGYPVKYEKGIPIHGFENFKDKDGYYCFHAGTKFKDGEIVTNGGRVLGITAKGETLKEARKNAYAATEWISFANKYMRHDSGKFKRRIQKRSL